MVAEQGRSEVLSQLGAGVFRANAEGVIEDADEGARALLPGLAIGARPAWLESLRAAILARGGRFDGALPEVEGLDGRAFRARLDEEGRLEGLVLSEARESELFALVERSPDGVVVHREGRVVYANPEACALLERPLVGALLPEPLTPPSVDRPGPSVEELRLTRGEGDERVLEITHLEGRSTGLVVLRDVTERRMLQARFAQADRLATVGTLAASVAHEINNPLTYVMHYTERLVGQLAELERELETAGASPPASRLEPWVGELLDGARIAAEGCQRMRDIIRDLRTFARVDDQERAPMDVNDAVRSAVQMVRHQLSGRGQLEVELAELPTVRAHEGRLCQVFLNLLLNAVHAIGERPSASVRRVRVSSWSDAERVFVSVVDTGPGIAAEHLGRLFEPFFSTKPGERGSGLGLWICREFAHELGGHIEVESEPGRGSSFTVVLPSTSAPAIASSHPPPRRRLSTLPPPRLRVLVVDDEPALRELLAEALRDRAEVQTAASGVEARSLLDSDLAFDVILCDVMMPEMSGVELFEWLQEARPALATRVVFMTGGAFAPDTYATLAEVDNPTLYKPFRVKDVELLIDQMPRV